MSDERKPAVLAGFRRSRIDPGRLREFAETGRQLQRERAAAADLVERLLKETPREEWPALAERGDLQTCGALEKLGNTVAQTVNRDPRQALAVAELAVSVAEAIPLTNYPEVVIAQLRAHAWKDVGQALGHAARYPEALEAFDRAESNIVSFGALGHDLAIVHFARASTLQEMGRYEESMALLAQCTEVFREHDDTRRLVLCAIAEGVLLHRLRKYREAREAYLLLLAETRDSIDRESLACLHLAIGHCSVDLADYPAADVHLSRAAELFDEIGQPLRSARAEIGRGRLLIRKGAIDRGITHLRTIRKKFLRHSMTEEAGICALEMIEGMLLRGDTADAEALARQVIAEFSAAALNTRAITALGYLQEAITSRRATTSMVSGVREYIVSLQTSPERAFVAPL
ncbi:MAG TPA: tetratricopeptide repeat protein [Thermoanaerobaculia bacterium]